MSLDIDVYNALDAQGVSPLIRGWLPETQALPCAVVRYMYDEPQITLHGEADFKKETIAVDCWGATLESAETARDQVLSAVNASSLNAVRLATRPLHEPEISTFRFTIEYSIRG